MSDLMATRLRGLLNLLALVLAGMWAVNLAYGMRDKNEVRKMTEKMKTVCVGRFLIDVPENAEVSLGRAVVDGFNISNDANETEQEFNARMIAREAEIKSTPNKLGGKNLEKVIDIKRNGFIGKIYIFGRTSTYVFYGPERVTYVNIALNGYFRANGISFNFISDRYDPDHVGHLVQLANQLKPLKENEIPTEPGFCIDRAIIVDPLIATQREQVVMFANLPGHPDLSIAFDTIAGIKPSEPLLVRNARVKENYSLMVRARFTSLREGSRTINGVPGDELLEKIREYNFSVGHNFTWESFIKQDSVFLPALSLELNTGRNQRAGGAPVDSSLQDGALFTLWDKISSSVRVRPTSAPKNVEAEPATAPLGSYALANTPCPQSGWWKFADGGETLISGGQCQYFRKGERLPQAHLLGPQTIWQKIKGEQVTFQRSSPTQWQLANYRRFSRNASTVALAQAAVASSGGAGMTPSSLQASASGAEAAPVGTRADTGTPCSASGWWRCADSGAVDGTRWFGRGTLLPVATYRSERSWLDKIKGLPEMRRRRGVWQLVRHDEGVAVEPTQAVQGVPESDA